MVETVSRYEGELHCAIIHGPSQAEIATDAPVDNMGKGESFSPTDMVGAALGSCILTTMAILGDRLGIDLKGATARVEKQMASDTPRRIRQLAVQITMPRGVPEEHRARLERAAHACPVHHSLHPDISIPISFDWG
jgi:putative redox protein